jgi:hypothetical protein
VPVIIDGTTCLDATGYKVDFTTVGAGAGDPVGTKSVKFLVDDPTRIEQIIYNNP